MLSPEKRRRPQHNTLGRALLQRLPRELSSALGRSELRKGSTPEQDPKQACFYRRT
jgi:hypothetical protein